MSISDLPSTTASPPASGPSPRSQSSGSSSSGPRTATVVQGCPKASSQAAILPPGHLDRAHCAPLHRRRGSIDGPSAWAKQLAPEVRRPREVGSRGALLDRVPEGLQEVGGGVTRPRSIVTARRKATYSDHERVCPAMAEMRPDTESEGEEERGRPRRKMRCKYVRAGSCAQIWHDDVLGAMYRVGLRCIPPDPFDGTAPGLLMCLAQKSLVQDDWMSKDRSSRKQRWLSSTWRLHLLLISSRP